jgi:hypothetical protein
MKGINEQIQQLEDCLFSLGVDQQVVQTEVAECKGSASSIGGDG